MKYMKDYIDEGYTVICKDVLMRDALRNLYPNRFIHTPYTDGIDKRKLLIDSRLEDWFIAKRLTIFTNVYVFKEFTKEFIKGTDERIGIMLGDEMSGAKESLESKLTKALSKSMKEATELMQSNLTELVNRTPNECKEDAQQMSKDIFNGMMKDKQVEFLDQTIEKLKKFKYQFIRGEVTIENAAMNDEYNAMTAEEQGGHNIYLSIDYQTKEERKDK